MNKNVYSDAQIFDAMREAYQQSEHKVLRVQDYEAIRFQADPASTSIIRRFGKWSDACKAADVPAVQRATRSRWTNEEMKTLLGQMKEELGRVPTYKEYERHPSVNSVQNDWPSASTIRLRFGKWSDATRGI